MDLANKRVEFLYLFMLFALLIGSVFTDLPIYEKTVTKSYIFLIAPLFFLLFLIKNKFKLALTPNSKVFLIYLFLTLSFSLLMLFIHIVTLGEIYAYNRNMFIKNFEAFFTLSFLHFVFYYLIINILFKINLNHLKLVIYFLFSFLTLTAFIEFINPEIIQPFHSLPKNYDRLRLFAMEPSQAGILYFLIGLMSLFLSKNAFVKFIIIVVLTIVLIFIQSKGLFISIILGLAVIVISNFNKLRYVFVSLIFLFLFMSIFFLYILPSLIIDIERFTSFSTRFSGLISIILILFNFPFGLGYGTYIYYYPELILKSYEFASALFYKFFGFLLSPNEILDIFYYGENIGAKAGIPQSVVNNGWFALIFWFILFRNSFLYIKNLKVNSLTRFMLKITILVELIQLSIGSEYNLLYIIWLPIAFIEVIYYKQRREMNYET